jgi:integrase
MPWVAITPELESLLREMQTRAVSQYLFASPHDPAKPRDASAVRHRLTAVCKKLKLRHCTPHGLRSFYVTEARQSGLSDAEIASLIGDKSGPALIASTYGDVRPDHLLAQARRIRHTITGDEADAKGSHQSSHTVHEKAACVTQCHFESSEREAIAE